MKPKTPPKKFVKPPEAKTEAAASAWRAEERTPSSQPEREDEDSDAVPAFAGSAEAADELEQERAADDGIPDKLGPR
jgi:hypothetical protein